MPSLTNLSPICCGMDTNPASSGEDICVVCQESISERSIAVPCRHKNFDFLCLLSWLEVRPSCPLCKCLVSSVNYDLDSPERPKNYIVPPTFSKPIPQHSTLVQPSRSPRAARTTGGYRRSLRSRQAYRQSSPNQALEFRRSVYKKQLYSSHVGCNRISRFRNLTPQIFRTDEELLSRARKWIRRELQVFEFLNPEESNSSESKTKRVKKANNAEFLLEYIIATLKSLDTQGSSGQAEDMLQEFLGRDNTRLFFHELRAFLKSPFLSLDDWDRAVQYREPRLAKDYSYPSGNRDASAHEASISAKSQVPLMRSLLHHERRHPYSSRASFNLP